MNAPVRPNILLVLADDMGNDRLSISGEAVDPPVTPFLDMLKASGVTFPNLYTEPACSSTRAAVLTGLAPWRNGIGEAWKGTSNGFELSQGLDSVFHAAKRASYQTIAVGKWHLTLEQGWELDAGLRGVDDWVLTQGNLDDFSSFEAYSSVHGFQQVDDLYSTTWCADIASIRIESAALPWFAWVAPHAAHEPYHEAPEELRTTEPDGTDYALWKGAVEALDVELSNLWAKLDAQRSRTLVLFVSDNGTPKDVSLNPDGEGKGTTGEGGCNTTLLAYAPWLAPGVCEDLVSVTDLFATLQAIVGDTNPSPVDSVPIRRLVEAQNGALPWDTRQHAFSEKFAPNGYPFTGGTLEKRQRMVRNGVWKLRRDDVRSTERFYDLSTAPVGQDGPEVTPPQSVQDELRAQLDAHSGPMGG